MTAKFTEFYKLVFSGFSKKADDKQGTGGTVKDIDGNLYHTVTIGTQVWMVENLKTTKYKDGTAMPLVTENATWGNLTIPGYCEYNNDAAISIKTYGALYNKYAITTGKLAPAGWQVVTAAEWALLTKYLGGDSIAGGKIKSTGTKEAGTGLWLDPNTGATNESGFTAVPAGGRLPDGTFEFGGYRGAWWSSSEVTAINERGRFTHSDFILVGIYSFNNNYGLPVRCVRDN